MRESSLKVKTAWAGAATRILVMRTPFLFQAPLGTARERHKHDWHDEEIWPANRYDMRQ